MRATDEVVDIINAPLEGAELVRGQRSMTNDPVNFLAILAGGWFFDLLSGF